MHVKRFLYIVWVVGMMLSLATPAVGQSIKGQPLLEADTNLHDVPSLQRGAKVYMNFCAGCHSLKYMRFKRLADDLEIPYDSVKANLIFDSSIGIHDPLTIAMPADDAANWFGIAPPDLSLTARVRGKDWLYSYLMQFYRDTNRPWGVNNAVFDDVAMPHVLLVWQGITDPVTKEITAQWNGTIDKYEVVDYLKVVSRGELSPELFDAYINDLVNFLTYVSEPAVMERHQLGKWVLLFLTVFASFAYLVKRLYWKRVV